MTLNGAKILESMKGAVSNGDIADDPEWH